MTTRTRIDGAASIRVIETLSQTLGHKPLGFWYSVDGEWEAWCRDNMTEWLEGRHVHDVQLGSERMVEIRTIGDLDAFHAAFVMPPELGLESDLYKGANDWSLDWRRVAENHDGIEIAPYLWGRRLTGPARWYYTWDCASGCIWRPRGVKVKLKEGARETS